MIIKINYQSYFEIAFSKITTATPFLLDLGWQKGSHIDANCPDLIPTQNSIF